MTTRRLASSSSSSSYMDAELPNSEDSFVFGANNTDLAQQLYYRARAGDTAKNVTLTSLPDAIQERLAHLKLDWKTLDGIAQRALLWDSGFVFSSSNEPVQIFTVARSMADLAFSVDDFEAVGCAAMNCTQPDGTTSYSNLYCNGAEMASLTKCLVENFEDDSETHSPMWATGGLFNIIPLPRIAKHEWVDGNMLNFVFAIHTLASRQEAAYGSPWVSRWLVESYPALVNPVSSTAGENVAVTTEKGSGSIGIQAIVGIVAACIVAALAVLGFIIGRRRRSIAKASQGQTGLWDDDVITTNRIPREKVRIDQLISRGAFGEVYNGIYNGQQVAIKMLLPSTRRDIKLVNAFLAEARLTAMMEHPRIVSCIGIAWDSLSDLCVVLEFMEGGDLRTLLNNYERARYPVGFNRENATIAVHVAHALTYMHSLDPPVIHRDLKSRNILLNEMREAKLTDFGISRERLDSTMTAGVGTSLWMAPEVMTGERYDDKADVFSFGVVLCELDLHTLPYAQAKQEMQDSHGRQMSDATLLQKVAVGQITVRFSNAGPQSMIELGKACVSMDPAKRPCAAEALCKLQEILHKELV